MRAYTNGGYRWGYSRRGYLLPHDDQLLGTLKCDREVPALVNGHGTRLAELYRAASDAPAIDREQVILADALQLAWEQAVRDAAQARLPRAPALMAIFWDPAKRSGESLRSWRGAARTAEGDVTVPPEYEDAVRAYFNALQAPAAR